MAKLLNTDFEQIPVLRLQMEKWVKTPTPLRGPIELKRADMEILLRIVEAAEGVLYPTPQELMAQQQRISVLTPDFHDANPAGYETLLHIAREFENKYC